MIMWGLGLRCVCVCNGSRPLYLDPNMFCVSVFSFFLVVWGLVLFGGLGSDLGSFMWALDLALHSWAGYSCVPFLDCCVVFLHVSVDLFGFAIGSVAFVCWG